MLENKELDGIVIVSPSAFHFDHIKKAVNKNSSHFCEKPLGLNLEEVYQINDYLTQSKYDKPFMLGFMRRFDPSYAEAKKMIDNGEIGKPYMIRCYGLDPIKWVKTAVPFAKHSGGIFLDMAVHDIDLARWFMDSEVSTIYASGQCYIEKGFEEHGDVDNGTALMNFDNGGMALFYTSRTCHHGYHIETEIVGTKGTLRVGGDPSKNLITLYTPDGTQKQYKDYFMDRFQDAYLNEMQAYVDCIADSSKPIVGVIDGIKATEIAYGCNKSYKEDILVRL